MERFQVKLHEKDQQPQQDRGAIAAKGAGCKKRREGRQPPRSGPVAQSSNSVSHQEILIDADGSKANPAQSQQIALTERLAKRESCRKQSKQEIEPRPGCIRQITDDCGDSRQNKYGGIQPRLVFGHRPRHQGKVADDGPKNTEIPLRSP